MAVLRKLYKNQYFSKIFKDFITKFKYIYLMKNKPILILVSIECPFVLILLNRVFTGWVERIWVNPLFNLLKEKLRLH